MARFFGAIAAAFVAWAFAAALEVPVWRAWDQPGDRTDITIMAFCAALLLSRRGRAD